MATFTVTLTTNSFAKALTVRSDFLTFWKSIKAPASYSYPPFPILSWEGVRLPSTLCSSARKIQNLAVTLQSNFPTNELHFEMQPGSQALLALGKFFPYALLPLLKICTDVSTNDCCSNLPCVTARKVGILHHRHLFSSTIINRLLKKNTSQEKKLSILRSAIALIHPISPSHKTQTKALLKGDLSCQWAEQSRFHNIRHILASTPSVSLLYLHSIFCA